MLLVNHPATQTQATAASNTLRNSNCVPTQHSRRQPNPLQHRNSLQCEEAVRRQFESVVRQESHEQKELLFYYCEIDCGVSNEKLFILEEGVVGGGGGGTSFHTNIIHQIPQKQEFISTTDQRTVPSLSIDSVCHF